MICSSSSLCCIKVCAPRRKAYTLRPCAKFQSIPTPHAMPQRWGPGPRCGHCFREVAFQGLRANGPPLVCISNRSRWKAATSKSQRSRKESATVAKPGAVAGSILLAATAFVHPADSLASTSYLATATEGLNSKKLELVKPSQQPSRALGMELLQVSNAPPLITPSSDDAVKHPSQGSAMDLSLLLPLAIINALGLEDAMPDWGPMMLVLLANVLGLKAVFAMLRRLGDKSEPVTLVRLQWGLVEDHSALRTRLSQLADMNQVGQQGTWLMMEEALAELARYQGTCELADVVAVHLESKSEAYTLFGEVARAELAKAQAEEAAAHALGEGECTADWSSPASPSSLSLEGTAAGAPGPAGVQAGAGGSGAGVSGRAPSLLQWLTRQPARWEGCDDACVVTLIVATRGHIDVPRSLRSWRDMCGAMKALCGLTSDRIMAVELSWAPSKDSEFLTRDQLVRDYSNLKAIKA